MALYDNIDLVGATIAANGNLVQGPKTYLNAKQGGGQNPLLFNNDGVRRIRTPSNQSAGTDRCEIDVSTDILADKVYHIGFNLYIPFNETTYPFPDNWFSLTQFRQNGAGSHSPGLSLSLTTIGSDFNLSLVGRGDGGYSRLFDLKLNGTGNDRYFNRWFNVIVMLKLSHSGEAAMFVDRTWGGAGIASGIKTHDLLLASLPATASTLKFGLYRGVSSHPHPYFINFSNYRLGDWYSDVKSW